MTNNKEPIYRVELLTTQGVKTIEVTPGQLKEREQELIAAYGTFITLKAELV